MAAELHHPGLGEGWGTEDREKVIVFAEGRFLAAAFPSFAAFTGYQHFIGIENVDDLLMAFLAKGRAKQVHCGVALGFGQVADVEGGLRLELPNAEHLDSVLEARGVSDDSRVVLYTSDKYFTPASRAFFALEYAGLRGRVSLMDGGLEAWKTEGRALTAEVPSPGRASFTPRLQTQMVVDAEFLKTRLEDPALALIDARDTSFYKGAETRQGRNGHIPGAKNLPFNTVMQDDGKFKDPATLGAMLSNAGAASGKTVITYCHIGQQASLVWFTARMAGFDAKIYDGSFQDWARRSDLPVISP
jgi:thiosulfate/3-mercaptopyruvate sulfurtransferase